MIRVGRWLAAGALAALLTWGLGRLLTAAWFMPPAASAEALLVDQAFDEMLAVTIPIYGAVIAVVVVAVVSFRSQGSNEEGEPSGGGSAVLQAAWVLASLVLTLRLAAYGIREYRLLRAPAPADLDVQVKASQWSWEFYYPAAEKYGSALYLPQGKRVRLLLTSTDVLHAFWVPEFRVKQDIVPGRVTTLTVTPTTAGDYLLTCAELCGADHTVMNARVQVLAPKDFDRTLREEF